MRFTGISVCYNLTYAVAGGLTPVVIPLLSQVTPLAAAHYVARITSYNVCYTKLLRPRGHRRSPKTTVEIIRLPCTERSPARLPCSPKVNAPRNA